MSESERATRATDTKEAIMEATYRALCSRGYADLTMQSIADEFDKSKACIHYHYDTKEDLLAAFLEHLFERFVERLRVEEAEGPEERLEAIVDALLFDLDEREADRDLHTALLEIRAQAPHRAAYREQLTANHAYVEKLLAETIADGIEEGTFRPVDPRETARLVLATMLGGRVYDLTLEDEDVAATVRNALEARVLAPLRSDGNGGEGGDGRDAARFEAERDGESREEVE